MYKLSCDISVKYVLKFGSSTSYNVARRIMNIIVKKNTTPAAEPPETNNEGKNQE